MRYGRIFTGAAVVLLLLSCLEEARAQEPYGFYRSDQVGPRVNRIDEEGFLNILSFKFPIESELPWTLTDRGYRITLGSLDISKLWHDQEIRVRAPISDSVSFMLYGVGGVDFDTNYVYIQPSVEWKVAERLEVLFPTSVEFDKGFFNIGLGARYRNPDAGIDYLQVSWLRAAALFGSHKITPENSSVNDPADALEFQGMGRIGSLGTSRLKVTWFSPSSFTYDDLDQTEEFKGIFAHWLHRADLDEQTSLFLEFTADRATERLLTGEPDLREDEFEGERDYYQFRVETHWELGEPGSRERIRAGFEYIDFFVDEQLPNDQESINTVRRKELALFGGYRYPFTEEFSLEGVVFATVKDALSRYPYDPGFDRKDDDSFQAKVNINLRWELNETSFIVLTPSFELDTFGWGGGGFQLVLTF